MSTRPIVAALDRLPAELTHVRAGLETAGTENRIALGHLLGISETRLAIAVSLFDPVERVSRFGPHKRHDLKILRLSIDNMTRVVRHLARILPPAADHQDHGYRVAQSHVCGPCYDLAGYSAEYAVREAVGIIADVVHVREPQARWCTVCRLRTSALGHRCSVCERYKRAGHVRERPRMLDSRALKALA